MISEWEMIGRLLLAAVLGSLIGLQREHQFWTAGLRTHMLVATGACLFMTVSAFGFQQALTQPGTQLDPSRIAAQIVTGIGFLGAGVIFKEGLSVRGLTTAASIWITAAIGILMGIGFYMPAILATVLTLSTLSIFRWIEARMPAHFYAHHFVRFARNEVMPEPQFKAFLAEHGFTLANMSQRLTDDGLFYEYRMVIRTHNTQNLSKIAVTLRQMPSVRAFGISPTGD